LLDAVEAPGIFDRQVAGRSAESIVQFGHAVDWTEMSVRLQLGDVPSGYGFRQQRISACRVYRAVQGLALLITSVGTWFWSIFRFAAA
jgi:hypothetical protein